MPPVVLRHLLKQRLVDVDAAFAAGTRHSPQRSFHRQRVHTGTRIDGVLADPREAAMVTDAAALPGTGIPGHLPVLFTMAIERATRRLVRAVRPQPDLRELFHPLRELFDTSVNYLTPSMNDLIPP